MWCVYGGEDRGSRGSGPRPRGAGCEGSGEGAAGPAPLCGGSVGAPWGSGAARGAWPGVCVGGKTGGHRALGTRRPSVRPPRWAPGCSTGLFSPFSPHIAHPAPVLALVWSRRAPPAKSRCWFRVLWSATLGGKRRLLGLGLGSDMGKPVSPAPAGPVSFNRPTGQR